MNKIILRIGGVPEHFNLPWRLAFETGMFQHKDYDITWSDYAGGTGAMCQALRERELDIAVILTEGIVADIVKGNPSKIVQLYVKSPLIWGIHTGKTAPFQNADDLEGKIYAISRYGSGSHIMTYVDANNRDWDPSQQKFLLVGNLQGGLEALQNRTADAFLWEKFMTKPYVDSGFVRRIGECITPWPCFVVAAHDEVLAAHPEAIRDIMQTIQQACKDFMRHPYAAVMIGWRFNLAYRDAQTWYNQTEWATTNRISKKMLLNVLHTLKNVGVIDHVVEPDTLCSSLTRFNESGV